MTREEQIKHEVWQAGFFAGSMQQLPEPPDSFSDLHKELWSKGYKWGETSIERNAVTL